MKSILFIAFLAIAAVGCDTPENTTGSDTSAPPTTTSSDSTMMTPSTTDTVTTTPVDTTGSMPAPSQPTDTTTR